MTWQPIETANKDHRVSILVCDKGGDVKEVSWWDSWYADKTNKGWMVANCDEEYGYYVDAIYWQPLPDPPVIPSPSDTAKP